MLPILLKRRFKHGSFKTLYADDYEQKRFDHSITEARKQDLKAVKINSLSSGIIQILFAVVLAGILWISMMPKMHLSAGALAAIIGCMIQLLRPIRCLTSLNSSIQIGLAGAQSVFDFLMWTMKKIMANCFIKINKRICNLMNYVFNILIVATSIK